MVPLKIGVAREGSPSSLFLNMEKRPLSGLKLLAKYKEIKDISSSPCSADVSTVYLNRLVRQFGLFGHSMVSGPYCFVQAIWAFRAVHEVRAVLLVQVVQAIWAVRAVHRVRAVVLVHVVQAKRLSGRSRSSRLWR